MRMDSLTIIALLFLFLVAPVALAQEKTDTNVPALNAIPAPAPAAAPAATTPAGPLNNFQLPDLTKRETFSAAMQLVIVLTVLSLAPAILIMMTSFTRIVI